MTSNYHSTNKFSDHTNCEFKEILPTDFRMLKEQQQLEAIQQEEYEDMPKNTFSSMRDQLSQRIIAIPTTSDDRQSTGENPITLTAAHESMTSSFQIKNLSARKDHASGYHKPVFTINDLIEQNCNPPLSIRINRVSIEKNPPSIPIQTKVFTFNPF